MLVLNLFWHRKWAPKKERLRKNAAMTKSTATDLPTKAHTSSVVIVGYLAEGATHKLIATELAIIFNDKQSLHLLVLRCTYFISFFYILFLFLKISFLYAFSLFQNIVCVLIQYGFFLSVFFFFFFFFFAFVCLVGWLFGWLFYTH